MLPIAICGFVTKGFVKLCLDWLDFFIGCSKNVNFRYLDLMRTKSAIVMSLVKMQLLTSFFDSQIHFISHLIEEVAIGGHVSYRWMFPIEQYLKTLKGFVR
jgi:hypothetical protein